MPAAGVDGERQISGGQVLDASPPMAEGSLSSHYTQALGRSRG
jgi:hypothetical protein